MSPELELRLLSLLHHEAEDVFQQGLEMLRAGGWSPRDRYPLARLLSRSPARAIDVMSDTDAQSSDMARRYAERCLVRLSAREAQADRPPAAAFTETLPLLLAPDPTGHAAAAQRCRDEASALRAQGRTATMAFTDPARYSAIRLLEVLADLLDGVGQPARHMAALVRQLAPLEPRGLVGHEEQARQQMCRDALEETLQELVRP